MTVSTQPPAGAAIRTQALPPLNRDQAAVIAAIQDVLFGQRLPCLLEGRAGTGKTRLVVELVRRWPGRVAVCAPTHKAAFVLRAMLLADPTIDLAFGFTRGAQHRPAAAPHRPVEARRAAGTALDGDGYLDEADAVEDQARVAVGTIHSLLGLQPLEDDQGKERLVPIADSTADTFSLIIVDECSMIGRALQNEINAISGIPVLYVGDRAQLPPVGEVAAPCFAEVGSHFRFTQIVRQHAGNPILRVASELRDQQQQQHLVSIDTAWTLNLPVWQPDRPGVFTADMDDIFAAFRAKPDRCRLLAYTNASTVEHNRRIREAVIGKTATPFIIGERCLVRAPVITLSMQGECTIVIPVNSEPTVRDIHADTIEIKVGGPLWKGRGKGWPASTLRAPVWCLVLLHEGQEITCHIERQQGMRSDWLNHATQSRRWDDRWRIRAALNDIRHLYACTAHTAQGCTYDTVFVDAGNLLLGGMADRMTRLKLLYTACTRPHMQLGVYWELPGFL